MFDQFGGKRRRFRALQVGGNRPVFFRIKGLNGPFPVTDDPNGNRLHPASTKAAFNFAPKERRYLIADKAIKDASRLLGLIFALVQFLGLIHGFEDGIAGQLMKQDTVKSSPFLFKNFGRMPGDRLAFPVGVRCQVDLRCVAGRLFERRDNFTFAGDGAILRLETVFNFDPHLLGRQVFYMTDRCSDIVRAAEIFFNGFDFGGRFHHD